MNVFVSEEGKTNPFDEYLPDGPVKDFINSYVDHLPNVSEDPITPETFIEPNDSSWTQYAVAYLLLYPYAVFIFAVLGASAFFVWKKWKRYRERYSKEPCWYCGTLLYRCAPNCQNCRSAHPNPLEVDLMGFTTRNRPAGPTHVDRLLRFRRCHFCGQYIDTSGIIQDCPACGTVTFSGMDRIRQFDRYVQRRRWTIYLVVFFVSFIPILGPLFSSTFYRRTLISPYKLYMSFGRDSILYAVLAVFRFLFKFLPFIGIVGIPVLAVVENHVYRKSFFMKARQS